MKNYKMLQRMSNFVIDQVLARMMKKTPFENNLLLMKFWYLPQKKGLGYIKSYSTDKDVLNYITSKNMSKTLRRANLKEDKNPAAQHSEIGFISIGKILSIISYNLQKSKQFFSLPVCKNILNFHTKSDLFGNVVSKESQIKMPDEEDPEHWGGTEAFKLITFIKNDFDQVLEKHPSILVFFSAYWCPHCTRLKKTFGAAALKAKKANLPIVFATFDVSIDPDLADEKGVVGIPTVKYFRNGKYVSTFKGKRTASDLFEFAKNPPAPVPETKGPDV